MIRQKRLFQEVVQKRRGYGWRKGTDENIKAGGKFAERLAERVLGGVRSQEGDGACDLWHKVFDAGVESKMGSNRDGVKVREDQLDSHLAMCEDEFPFSRYWYVFLKYRNSGPNGNSASGRLFQELVRLEEDVSHFFGEHTTGLYVLDISIVDAIRNHRGANMVIWRGDRVSSAICIRWKLFSQIKEAPNQVLSSLGLNPRKYRLNTRFVKVEFEGQKMEFEFLSLLDARLVHNNKLNPTLFPIGMRRKTA